MATNVNNTAIGALTNFAKYHKNPQNGVIVTLRAAFRCFETEVKRAEVKSIEEWH